MTYAEKLKSPKWQKRRLEILKRDKFKCKKCADEETTLHVHHLSYHGEPWEAPSNELDTLCQVCHQLITDLQKDEEEVFDYDKIHILKYGFYSGRSLLIFSMADGQFCIRILDKDNTMILTFYMKDSLSIKKILNKSLKNFREYAE